ncbi:M48 family metallopeptidase [Psychroflexus salis]|uniref:Peptidase M48 n=1 Tax=Psychroflexus salis TaxID=1526574 RepID=A0A916ZSH5_9FLAO|nr:M48 family metallopeptidase [Psychroflexus salis]GGE11889.1 peptidase M48 [Psychroflexus salis]
MTATILFWLIIGILVIEFVIDKVLDFLNTSYFDKALPESISDVYEKDEYKKAQAYKKENQKFSQFSSAIMFMVILAFLFLDGFAWVDNIARNWFEHEIYIGLSFFGILFLASSILGIPFSYYSTFVIEEKYGFNKTTKNTFFLDILKSWLLAGILGGGILALLMWFFELAGKDFWWYAWIIISLFSILMNMFYAKLIVPLFNKQTPLANGSLRDKIEAYAKKVGFELKNIYIIDGSKRSTKANAYFSGFGKEKRITLFDTLVEDLTEEEVVAVLAHEVGHYKKKHIIFNLIASILTTGLTLWIFSLLVNEALLAEALGTSKPSFHLSLVAFGLLYSPISTLTGLVMNVISRKFEYQADAFAKHTFNAKHLVTSLKKLSSKSLSNLTPHPAYVYFNYSHPPLQKRIENLNLES